MSGMALIKQMPNYHVSTGNKADQGDSIKTQALKPSVSELELAVESLPCISPQSL